METFLVKLLAVLLALSQVTTAPDAINTQFDRTRDQEQVAGLLRAGCTHMRKVFDIEGLVSMIWFRRHSTIRTRLLTKSPISWDQFRRSARGLSSVLRRAKNHRQAIDLGEVIEFYNKAAADLPDHAKLRGLRLPGASILLDSAGQPFAELFEENKRRAWVALTDIPIHVQSALSRRRTDASISTRGSTSAA